MSIDIPDDILSHHSAEEVRRELAFAMYEKMIFTRTQVREFLGIDEESFSREARSRGVYVRYDVEDLEQDVETINRVLDR